MRSMRVLILLCATVSAMGAMWLMRAALQSEAAQRPVQQQPVAATPEVVAPKTVDVLVAAREIKTGRRLSIEDLRWQPWPVDSVSDTFYKFSEDPEAIESLIGDAARLVIADGEPVTTAKIVDIQGTGVLAALLRPGMRAVSLPVDEITGAGGFILPGDFVDLLLTRQITIDEIDEESGEIVRSTSHNQTDTVMETVRVLAIDQALQSEGQASVGRSATLELLPDQVELLTLTRQIATQKRGFITLSLRSFEEMADTYGEELDKVMPRTMLDLREVVMAARAKAEETKVNYEDYIARKKAAAEAERIALGGDEDPRNAEIAARQKLLDGTTVDAATGAPVEAGAEAPVAAAEEPTKPSTITLIRNGAPIVVHTVQPNQGGAQ